LAAVFLLHKHEGVFPVQSSSVQFERDFIGLPEFQIIGPVIPDGYFSCAILPLRNFSFECSVLQVVIVHCHRQTFNPFSFRWSFGYCPRLEDAVHFKPEVEVVMRRPMLMYNKSQGVFDFRIILRRLIQRSRTCRVLLLCN